MKEILQTESTNKYLEICGGRGEVEGVSVSRVNYKAM